MSALLPFLAALLIAAPPADKPAEVRSRTFQFTYAAVVTGLKPDQPARVWLPVASSNDDQDVAVVSKDLPAEGKIGKDSQYGNELLYVEARADADGKIPLKVVYKVTRREVRGDGGKEVKEGLELIARYLRADARVPIDGKPLELLKGKDVPKDQMAAAKVIYDVIDDTLKYGKDKPGWGNGDSVWACDSKTGNCSDFHSLFMSLARSRDPGEVRDRLSAAPPPCPPPAGGGGWGGGRRRRGRLSLLGQVPAGGPRLDPRGHFGGE